MTHITDLPILHGPRLFASRYQLLEVLGEGGMGTVYRAADRLSGEIIALKRVLFFEASNHPDSALATENINARLMLAQEFRTLSSLRHPHIISVLDYGFDDQRQPYFTMDLLPDAITILEAGTAKSLPEKVELLSQLLQALAYLHRRGIVHRDLKPANVLVQDGQVKVLDFGLAAAVGEQGSPTGTFAYMAPEVLEEHRIGPRSDLYSVGIIAFELFSGVNPMTGDTAHIESFTAVVNRILYAPPDLSLLGVIEPALVEIIQTLLAKLPEDRFPDAFAVIEALQRAIGQTAIEQSLQVRESFLHAAHFVGREQELHILSQELRAALKGDGSAWLVGGESGVGKSRLLSEVATLALIQDALVLRGQALQDGARPYQLWREAVRRLVLAVDVDDDEIAVLQNLAPDINYLLDREVGVAVSLTPAAQRDRINNTVLDILRRSSRPIVIILEDLHWALEESLSLLRRIVASVQELRLLVIASYRVDENALLPTTLEAMQILKLNRLTLTEMAQLSTAMLGQAGQHADLVQYFARETEGNTLFLVEVARALTEETGQIHDVSGHTLPAHILAGGIQRLIQRRLNRLPAEAIPALQAAAILGRDIDPALIAAMFPDLDIEQWLLDGANAAILEVQQNTWRFSHDKLREGALLDVDAERKRTLHHDAARAIEKVYPGSYVQVAVLAYHWRMADDPDQERRYAELAGDQLHAVSTYPEAVAHYLRTLSLSQLPAERTRLLYKLGNAYFWMGQFSEAGQYYESSLGLAHERSSDAEIACAMNGLGSILLHQGKFIDAQGLFEQALTTAQRAEEFPPITDALTGLGDAAWRMNDYPAATRYLEENLTLARANGTLPQIGNALNMIGILYAMQRRYAESEAALEESLAIAYSTGDRSRVAQALSNLGEVALIQGFYETAEVRLQKALQISMDIGNQFSTANVHLNLGIVAVRWHPSSTAPIPSPYGQALKHLLTTLRIAYRIGSVPLCLGSLAVIGYIMVRKHQTQDGLTLMGLALHHPGGSPDMYESILDPFLAELRQTLAEQELTTGLHSGKSLDFDDAIAGVLSTSFD